MDQKHSFLYTHASKVAGLIVLAASILFVAGVWRNATRLDELEWTAKAAELLLIATGLFSILLVRTQLVAQERQLQANFRQLVDDNKWRTYISYHEHFNKVPSDELRKSMYDLATNLGFISHFDNLGHAMPANVCQSIIQESNHWQIVRPYLDHFEEFCGAINAGIVDEDYAYSLQATRVIRNFTVFEQLIRHYQQGTGTAYIELQKVAIRWSVRAGLAEVARKEAIGVGSGTAGKIVGPSGGTIRQ